MPLTQLLFTSIEASFSEKYLKRSQNFLTRNFLQVENFSWTGPDLSVKS